VILGSRIPDWRFWIGDWGFGIDDKRSESELDAPEAGSARYQWQAGLAERRSPRLSWIPDPQSLILDPRSWILDPGLAILDRRLGIRDR